MREENRCRFSLESLIRTRLLWSILDGKLQPNPVTPGPGRSRLVGREKMKHYIGYEQIIVYQEYTGGRLNIYEIDR
jgi:hypothetical protein